MGGAGLSGGHGLVRDREGCFEDGVGGDVGGWLEVLVGGGGEGDYGYVGGSSEDYKDEE